MANNNSKKSLTTVMVTGASPYNDATENTHALFSVAVFRSLPNGSCRLFSSFLPIRRVSICVLAFFLCFLVCLRHLSSFLMFDKYVPCSHLRMCCAILYWRWFYSSLSLLNVCCELTLEFNAVRSYHMIRIQVQCISADGNDRGEKAANQVSQS